MLILAVYLRLPAGLANCVEAMRDCDEVLLFTAVLQV